MKPVSLGTRWNHNHGGYVKTAIVRLDESEIPEPGELMPRPEILVQACEMMEIQPARRTKDLVIEPATGLIERDQYGVLLVVHQIATPPQEE